MNATQALTLTRLVRGACPSQKFDEYTPDLWFEMLRDLQFDDARQAVIELGKRQTFISPAEIRGQIQSVRNARIRDAYLDLPAADADPDDIGLWLASVRAENARIASGAPELPPVSRGFSRDVEALLGETVAAMPVVPGSSDSREWREVAP